MTTPYNPNSPEFPSISTELASIPLPPAVPEMETLPLRKYLRVIVPALLLWIGILAGIIYLIYERSRVGEKYNRATLREWVEQTRPHRKNLLELGEEYLEKPTDLKREEILVQFEAMTEPIRMYSGRLPLFVEMYELRLDFPGRPDLESIMWRNPQEPLRAQKNSGQVRGERILEVNTRNGKVAVFCEYRMRALDNAQREEFERQRWTYVLAGVGLGGGIAAILWIYFFLRRERRREILMLERARQLEHAENLTLAAKLRTKSAEEARKEADSRALQREAELALQRARAAEAERNAMQLQSNMHENISIVAMSHAHNIKNLLVRPNDLLTRCLERDGLPNEQSVMLVEVQGTLGEVTERLQQILRTVRRDPTRSEMMTIELNNLFLSLVKTWTQLAGDKWKLNLVVDTPSEPLKIRGDWSNLQQAAENLVFNARDATFEMRNHLREMARAIDDPTKKKKAILDAAGWKGEIRVSGYRQGDRVVVEVKDNGIGMTEEVRQKCIQTHFTTKRDNALFAGLAAGMGLGLSFVVMVMEAHSATLEIESHPLHGAMFRMSFPAADQA